MLVMPDGRAIRYAVEADPGVVSALKAEHPQLGLRFLPMHREWAIVWYWDANDPRRASLHDTTLPFNPDAHSIVCFLPEDCSPQDAASFARNHLHINPSTDDVRKAMEKTVAANASREAAIMSAALDDVMNRIELSHKGLSELFSDGAAQTAEVGERIELTEKEQREISERMREESEG